MFVNHASRPYAFFLDRAGDTGSAFAGSQPVAQLAVLANGTCLLWTDGGWQPDGHRPLDSIEAFVEESAAEPVGQSMDNSAPPRTVGYLAYELGAFMDQGRGGLGEPSGTTPLALLSTYDRVDRWDARTGNTTSINFEPQPGRRTVPASAAHELRRLGGDQGRVRQQGRGPVSEERWRRDYKKAFARIKEAIAAGEIYQANLARKITVQLNDDPVCIYRRIRHIQPVSQGAYLDTGTLTVLCNSPESFLKIRGDRISTYPIKGTRPRHENPNDDETARAQLRSDPKELAEHVMIVDLERNDLGRICKTGTVKVDSYAQVASFATIHHLVSKVSGVLRQDCRIGNILKATFPGGSITGAPKIRAMEIIAEVEPSARGVYTGAIGSFNGSRFCDLNIAIRTAVCDGRYIHYMTGGGIVADSELEKEIEETHTKAKAFLDAFDQHLDPQTVAR